jgi:hypothetical protein
VGYTSSLINKYYNNTRLNYINNISVSVLFFTIYTMTTLAIILINIIGFNYNITTTYSYITSL